MDIAEVAMGPEPGNVIGLDLTTTAQRVQIPDGWQGKQVVAGITGGAGLSAHVLFGGATVAVDNDGTSTVVAEVITFTADVGGLIHSGVESRMVVPLEATHMSIAANSGTPKIRMRLAQ